MTESELQFRKAMAEHRNAFAKKFPFLRKPKAWRKFVKLTIKGLG